MNFTPLENLDLFSVGIATAAIAVLGFAVLFTNRESATNRSFFLLSASAVSYSVVNYFSLRIAVPEIAILIIRLTVFFAAWYAFGIFHFLYIFPKEKISFPTFYKFLIFPLVVFTSLTALTPVVIYKATGFSSEGFVSTIDTSWGIALFSIVVVGLMISSIVVLIRKVISAKGIERVQFKIISTGLLITFLLHIIFNFIFPAFLDDTRFIALAAVFTFPFVSFTAYAIFKHHLLNVKLIATEILTFTLASVTLYEVILAQSLVVLFLRSGIFFLVLSFGILLIRSVRKEVEQREKLQKLTEELEAKNVKLKELDQLKSEFLGFAAHQVKGPMNNVKGFADLIATGAYGQVSDEAREKALKIKENAQRTVALVGNLLDLRKIEEGKMDFAFTQVDIVKVAKEMAEDYKVSAGAKGLDLQFASVAPSLLIKADEQKIRQVIQNVIDNSIKYTDAPSTSSGQKGFVKVAVEEQGDYALISVVDSGRGMSPELVKKLFGRFVRDEQTAKEIQGTGLGLYIAKQIVTAHHGQIWAESDGEGKGSRFFVRLAKQ